MGTVDVFVTRPTPVVESIAWASEGRGMPAASWAKARMSERYGVRVLTCPICIQIFKTMSFMWFKGKIVKLIMYVILFITHNF